MLDPLLWTPGKSTRLLLGILIFLLPGSAGAEDPVFTYVIQEGQFGAVDDVQISVDPTLAKTNLGGMKDFGIWQHDGVALVRFDLNALPKEIVLNKASLKLFCSSVGFSDAEINRDWPVAVYAFQHPWLEGTGTNEDFKHDGATASTHDGKSSWPKGSPMASVGTPIGSAVHQGGSAQWYEWPLKAEVVNEWITGKRPNHGLIVWGKAPGKAVSFSSSETPEVDKRPQLKLTVSLPIKAMVENALGSDDAGKSVTHVKKVTTFINPVNDRITVNVDWRIDATTIPESEVVDHAKSDVRKLMMIGSRLGPALNHIDIRGFFGTESKFGEGSGALYINAHYSRDTLAKVKWDSFSTADVFEIADSVELHNEFRALLNQAADR